MKHQLITSVLIFFLILGSVSADLYRIDCNVESKSIDVIILKRQSIEDSDFQEGLFFYAYNWRKTSIFMVWVTQNNRFDIESITEFTRPGFAKIFPGKEMKIKNVSTLKIPDSAILMVGNVQKNEFIKISDMENLAKLKARVSKMISVANSLIFRGSGFQKKVEGDRLSTGLLAGDIVIVPAGSTFKYGENLHRMDGHEIILNK